MKKVCQSFFSHCMYMYTPEVSVNRGWTDKGKGGGYNDHCCLLPGERESLRELPNYDMVKSVKLAIWPRGTAASSRGSQTRRLFTSKILVNSSDL